jgi:hypothetical protein
MTSRSFTGFQENFIELRKYPFCLYFPFTATCHGENSMDIIGSAITCPREFDYDNKQMAYTLRIAR